MRITCARFLRVVSVTFGAGLTVVIIAIIVRGFPDADREMPSAVSVRGEPLDLPQQHAEGGYVSSTRCRECHAGQFDSWHASFHRTMTQVADASTVLAPFDGVELSAHGRNYRLLQDGDTFLVDMPDPDFERAELAAGADSLSAQAAPVVQRRIVLTTGSHHVQAYWVQGAAGNALYNFPFVYHIADQRWLPREDSFLAPPNQSRHLKTWNMHCISCHSVNGHPGFDFSQERFKSSVAEFGIACEACHGPGADHIRLQKTVAAGQTVPNDPIVNPAKQPHHLSSQICGQCHSAWAPSDINQWMTAGSRFRPGQVLEKKRHLITHRDPLFAHDSTINDGLYWPDGTIRVGGREYQGMIASKCHQDGKLSCLSCHSMHQSEPNDQLAAKMEGDLACLQCHSEYADRLEEHTHHRADSSGSRCYNCHMPHTSYALFKAIRSHRVESPDVTISFQTGKPNACNQCHLDRSLGWTAQHLQNWYDIATDELDDDSATIAASVLWLLRGDAAQRVIAAWSMGWQPAMDASGGYWQARFLAQLLNDPYSAVRYVAARSLRRYSGFEDFEYDFIAEPSVRTEAVNRAIAIWSELSKGRPGDDSEQILMDQDGRLLEQMFYRLIDSRDDRPIEIAE